jgi:hypothetical protein
MTNEFHYENIPQANHFKLKKQICRTYHGSHSEKKTQNLVCQKERVNHARFN